MMEALSKSGMVVVDREDFQALRRVLPAATKEQIQKTFGVSETTWVKLRDGRPLRRSTLERILHRYGLLADQAGRQGV